jgi:hypothetical protein
VLEKVFNPKNLDNLFIKGGRHPFFNTKPRERERERGRERERERERELLCFNRSCPPCCVMTREGGIESELCGNGSRKTGIRRREKPDRGR